MAWQRWLIRGPGSVIYGDFDFMGLISNVFNHANFLFPANNISVPGGVGVIGETYGLYSGERAGQRMVEVRGRIEF